LEGGSKSREAHARNVALTFFTALLQQLPRHRRRPRRPGTRGGGHSRAPRTPEACRRARARTQRRQARAGHWGDRQHVRTRMVSRRAQVCAMNTATPPPPAPPPPHAPKSLTCWVARSRRAGQTCSSWSQAASCDRRDTQGHPAATAAGAQPAGACVITRLACTRREHAHLSPACLLPASRPPSLCGVNAAVTRGQSSSCRIACWYELPSGQARAGDSTRAAGWGGAQGAR
jgi:hypothetical protein